MGNKKQGLGLLGIIFIASACSAELKQLKGESDDDGGSGSTYYGYGYGYGGYDHGYHDGYNDGQTPNPGVDGDDAWRQSCDSEECRELTVYVHYLLTKDLGDGVTVRIEAFDNPNFTGSPRGTGEVNGFAARAGEWKDTTMYLVPGEYYLRAYLRSDGDANTTPYPLGDMQLVAGTPVGVYGALSHPQMIRVAPESESALVDPVHLNLDQLFEKPGTAPETNARLRIQISTPDGLDVPDHKKVLVQLHDSTDLARSPVYAFELASEQFLVAGRTGKAEFVSPSLAEGDYIAFAFLDGNDNGFYDDGELAAVYKQDGLPRKLAIRKDRIETIALPLTATPELPR
jgi:hypothetical protein